MAKDIEGGASADEEEKEYAQVEPELKEWYDAQVDREKDMVRKYAKELIEDGGYEDIPQEKIEAVLEEVVNHENLETKENAEEFFNA